jgi:hypothetical protein
MGDGIGEAVEGIKILLEEGLLVFFEGDFVFEIFAIEG